MEHALREDRDPSELFAESAEEYCAIIDHVSDLPKDKFLILVEKAIAILYARALMLPEGELGKGTSLSNRSADISEWQKLVQRLSKKLGASTTYWVVFTPPEKEEPVAGNLADDLTDIYGDVARGLQAYRKGSKEHKAEAVWHWRLMLGHWGNHATGALRALASLNR